MKIIRIVSSVPSYIIGFFRKIKLDNFVGGLIFGAIFSLVVNIFTVQFQESISKQRSLEALEREIAQHLLDSDQVFNELQTIRDTKKNNKLYYYPNAMYKTLDTAIWDSGESSKYVFELEPSLSAELTTYFSAVVKPQNSLIKDTQEQYKKIYEARCDLVNQFLDPNYIVDNNFCLDVTIKFMELIDQSYANNDVHASELLDKFHPTQDRLDSKLLKFVLGDKSVEMLKRPKK